MERAAQMDAAGTPGAPSVPLWATPLATALIVFIVTVPRIVFAFRYGLIGHADGSLWLGAVTLIAVNLALLVANYLSFERGSRMKP